ncbi:carbohydrate kinase family protein [Robertkochia solimangrovi]|uniref:carbohydrate kinase family protein n=1 Tax=Robertkochia solimangrovi TaxID=2213046 RepID=UPI00117FD270|nr:carbohydrate kinase [Robertkochia solimangrovi]TRZ45884.1 carbohydrate kinase [Robertkochia solimangrovi]
MKNVICFGEMLIDFVAETPGGALAEAQVFSKKAGGAPANVAAAVSLLGGNSYFVGCVGKDAFGTFLIDTISEIGINTQFVTRSDVFTTLAFVALDETGEREFVFSRGADAMLKYNPELRTKFVNDIFHFGAATSFLGGELEAAYYNHLLDAVTSGSLISFDPNFRIDLWKGRETIFVEKVMPYLRHTHFGKFSEEEAMLITGRKALKEACADLHDLGVMSLAITLGANGVLISNGTSSELVDSIKVNPKDTTGAGDAFVGCFLWQLSKYESPLKELNDLNKLCTMATLANKAGAITTLNYGAIPAMPDLRRLSDYE